MSKTTIFILVLFIGLIIAGQSLLKYHLGFVADIHHAYQVLEKKRPTLDQVESAVEAAIPDFFSPIELEEIHEEQAPFGLRLDCSLTVSADMDIYKVYSEPILQDPEEVKSLDLIPKDLREMALADVANTVFIPGFPAGMTFERQTKQLLFKRGEEITLKVNVRASENSRGGWTTEADIEDAPWKIKTPGCFLKTALELAEDEAKEIKSWSAIWKKYWALENNPAEKNRVLKAFASQKQKQPTERTKKEELRTTQKTLQEQKPAIPTPKRSFKSNFEPCIVKVAFFKADAVYKERGSKITIRITKTLKILSYTIPEGTRAFGWVLKNDGKKGIEVQFVRAVLPRGTVVKFSRKAKVIPI
ncbi:hypothetical protein [Methylacidiphilum caldifontis]|uniref:Uncharacterized protein n=1 Tax=Methylacidiphilum caldifontis TaxID=2795386 RepID=A0A4Y8PCP3_9BACT|nr:hypothetical protein [Methylacidiphilum caldifontis]TFE68518.1 hypothetical protein A7Q10_08515 [Methylacidiphilum caldifontis]